MLPLGPHSWGLNGVAALFGMSIFFTLSGFLIVGILWRDQHIGRFLTRRLARIVPLAWLALTIAFLVHGATPGDWVASLLFVANLPPFHLENVAHFWSLGVEMQFYAAIALVVAAAGRKGLWLVPIAALAVTALRIATASPVSIVTWLRVDEILAGGCLALIHLAPGGGQVRRWLARIPWWLLLLMTVAACHHASSALAYLRPYLTAAMVGALLYQPHARIRTMLESRPLAYVARISFALYVIHIFALQGWFSEGGKLVKYAKRPLSIAITFALAHVSTTRFEAVFIRWSHNRPAPTPLSSA